MIVMYRLSRENANFHTCCRWYPAFLKFDLLSQGLNPIIWCMLIEFDRVSNTTPIFPSAPLPESIVPLHFERLQESMPPLLKPRKSQWWRFDLLSSHQNHWKCHLLVPIAWEPLLFVAYSDDLFPMVLFERLCRTFKVQDYNGCENKHWTLKCLLYWDHGSLFSWSTIFLLQPSILRFIRVIQCENKPYPTFQKFLKLLGHMWCFPGVHFAFLSNLWTSQKYIQVESTQAAETGILPLSCLARGDVLDCAYLTSSLSDSYRLKNY